MWYPRRTTQTQGPLAGPVAHGGVRMWLGIRKRLQVEDHRALAEIADVLKGTLGPSTPWAASARTGRLTIRMARLGRVRRFLGELHLDLRGLDAPVVVVRQWAVDAPRLHDGGQAMLRATPWGLEACGVDDPSLQRARRWLDGVHRDEGWLRMELRETGLRVGYLDFPVDQPIDRGLVRSRAVGWASLAGRVERAAATRSVSRTQDRQLVTA